MPENPEAPKPEFLPPESERLVRSPQDLSVLRKILRIAVPLSVAAFAFWLFTWALGMFFSIRGVQNMLTSRVFLAVAYLALVGVVVTLAYGFRLHKAKLISYMAIVALLIVVIALDLMFPMPMPTHVASMTAIHSRPPEWRTIKDWQQAELSPVLEQFPNNTLRIIVTSSAPDETVDYANQFRDFFHAHQWNVIGPETAATDQIVQNIQLSISEQYVGKHPEAFAAVESQMRFVGIRLRSAVFVLDPLIPPNELVMWVGPETPLGFPEHVPLILGMACQHPLQFTDDTMHFFGGGGKDFVRWVRIKPPADSRFSAGQKVLVALTKPAKSVATSEQFRVQALGTLMPRPDTLDVTVTKQLKVGEFLDMRIISDEELRVKCVADRSSS